MSRTYKISYMKFSKPAIRLSLVQKSVLIVFTTVFVLILASFLVADDLIMDSYRDLEQQEVAKNTNRAAEALAARITALDTFCGDWSCWDDTYEFMQGINPAFFIARNLGDDTFLDYGLSLIAFYSCSGNLVYAKSWDFLTSAESALPPAVPVLFRDGVVTGFTSPEDHRSGVLNLSGVPCMIAARPVLTSIGEGPIAGTIIMGRRIDAEILDALGKATHLDISLLETGQFETATAGALNVSCSGGDVLSVEKSNELITGYTLIDGLDGRPAFGFAIDISRDIVQQGKRTLAFLHFCVFLAGVIFCGMLIWLMRAVVLSRLVKLGKKVDAIDVEQDYIERISLPGNDELSRISENVNNLLQSVETARTKLRAQQELISHVLEDMPSAILVFDEQGRIMFANRKFGDVFSLDLAGLSGACLFDRLHLVSLFSPVKVFLGSGQIQAREEFRFQSHDRDYIFTACYSRLEREGLVVLVLSDVTDELNRQERMYMADRLASVGQIASGVAHEVNNPLTSIIAISRDLAEQDLPADCKEDIRNIYTEAKRCAAIVKDLLAFARERKAAKEPILISSVVNDVVKLRAHSHRNQSIHVEVDVPEDLPPVLADYYQVQQVLLNIVLNAEYAMYEHNERGSLRISGSRKGDTVKISVEDDGPGIRPEVLRNIFDPFFTTKPVGKGTGLGLSICHGIIQSHNGKLYAVNNPRQGATFTFELPIVSASPRQPSGADRSYLGMEVQTGI